MFIKTIRKATDLAHRIDWPLLGVEQHHSKVIDLAQLIINDLFILIGSSQKSGNASEVASDFIRTFYPDIGSPRKITDGNKSRSPSALKREDGSKNKFLNIRSSNSSLNNATL